MPFRALRSGVTTYANAWETNARPNRRAALGSSGRGAESDGNKGATLWSNAPAITETWGAAWHWADPGCRTREQSRGAPQHKAASVSERFGFRSGAKHLGLSETVALRGAAAEGDLGRVHRREGESPAPSKQRCGDPGARGNGSRRGARPSNGKSFARLPSARASCESGSCGSSSPWYLSAKAEKLGE